VVLRVACTWTEKPRGVGNFRPVCMRMNVGSWDRGYHRTLIKHLEKVLASAAIIAALSAGVWLSTGTPTIAGGETRTISLYHVHTKENITVTYMVNGRYVPSAMKKINYLLRDWRRNEVITIDPKTIDLVWELHADLGSHAPVHVVCGYRSSKTNAFLKRVGRNVAKKSQHILGRAMDIYFPDVPTKTMRNSALVRQVGGVGYYRSAGGPTGFLHVDSGHVRHWGPAIGKTEMAQIFRDSRKTIGARLSGADRIMLAASEKDVGPSVYDAVDAGPADSGDEEDLASLSEDASKSPADDAATAAVPVAKPVQEVPKDVVQGYPVPKPRPKPIEVLMMAAANMDVNIQPASAPPPSEVIRTKPSVVNDSIGVVEGATTIAEASAASSTNANGKGNFAASLRNGTAKGAPLIKPMMASAGSSDINWWPQALIFNPEQAIRRNGTPQAFTTDENPLVPTAQAQTIQHPVEAAPHVISADMQQTASGKGDSLVVQRQGKGSLPAALPDLLVGSKKIGEL
jgi:uncharacterized protein YcbK (DUF882 family)